jgi:hypothetical protein
MSFESTYQLTAPVADTPEALVYRAQIKLTGEEVWVHIVRPGAAELFELARKHAASAGFGERQILEVVQDGVKSYLVTRPLPPNASLRDWLYSLGQAKTPDPSLQGGAWKLPSSTPDFPTHQMPAYKPPTPPLPQDAPTMMMPVMAQPPAPPGPGPPPPPRPAPPPPPLHLPQP